MNKIPRFMKEYANFQSRNIEHNELMQEELKTYGINRIQKALRLYERGKITVCETMNVITNCFD